MSIIRVDRKFNLPRYQGTCRFHYNTDSRDLSIWVMSIVNKVSIDNTNVIRFSFELRDTSRNIILHYESFTDNAEAGSINKELLNNPIILTRIRDTTNPNSVPDYHISIDELPSTMELYISKDYKSSSGNYSPDESVTYTVYKYSLFNVSTIKMPDSSISDYTSHIKSSSGATNSYLPFIYQEYQYSSNLLFEAVAEKDLDIYSLQTAPGSSMQYVATVGVLPKGTKVTILERITQLSTIRGSLGLVNTSYGSGYIRLPYTKIIRSYAKVSVNSTTLYQTSSMSQTIGQLSAGDILTIEIMEPLVVSRVYCTVFTGNLKNKSGYVELNDITFLEDYSTTGWFPVTGVN